MKHLTDKELAERWGMHKGSLANWRVQGIGPKFIKVGKKVLYAVSDVETWENKQKRRSTVG